jgi:hypothetical protein
MKKKSLLVLTMLVIAAVVPIIAFQAQAILSAGPNQSVSQGQSVKLNGTTTDNVTTIVQVTWNFGDNSTGVNGSTSALLNATHTYALPGVYNASLTVKFDSTLNKTETAFAMITVSPVLPVVNAGQNVTVEQTSHAGTQVTLNGTATSPISTLFNFTWSEGNTVLKTESNVTNTTLTRTFNLGTHLIVLNATDPTGNTGSGNVTVKVVDTMPPVVNAGPDLTVEQASHAGTQVKLNGTATDICSERFNFTWSEKGAVLATTTNATNTTLTYTFNLGTHILTLNATDQAGNTGSDNVTVKVIDTTPPQLNVTATPSDLWPPDHTYVEVKVNATAFDICDPSPKITFVSIKSNEPDNGLGDGNTVNDIVIINDFTFDLRAERSGTGSGRTYTITYMATDASNNTATVSVMVTVPHNQ